VVGATLGARAAFAVAGAGVLAVVVAVLLAWPRRQPGGYSSSSYSDSAATSRPPAPHSLTSRKSPV
jgi:hypothetical protein